MRSAFATLALFFGFGYFFSMPVASGFLSRDMVFAFKSLNQDIKVTADMVARIPNSNEMEKVKMALQPAKAIFANVDKSFTVAAR